MKTAIVTDSTAYLPLEIREKYNIHMVPLSVNMEDGTYEEEISITAQQFYEKVKNASSFPKTTQPSLGRFMEVYNELAKQYEDIVTIHLSSGISGTFSGALQASEMVEGVKIYAFDSEVAAYPQGMFAIYASQLAEKGASGAEIIEALEALKKTQDAYFIVDDLAHLQRGGRLSAASAFIGGLLQVKPVLRFENKVIVPFEKIRTRKKAMRCAEEQLIKAVEKYGELNATVVHSNCEADADEWISELSQKYPTVHFEKSYFGPVIGTHLGEGAIAIGWMKKF